MDCPVGEGRTLSQFALVSYIPGRLAAFLDQLRLDLTPGCNPRAHVTVLPPRPIDNSVDLPETIRLLAEESKDAAPFEVSLGEIQVFPVTNVIYLSVARGERELHALHENLNSGQLEYDGPYPYHPHVTIAQNIDPGDVERLAGIAREQWAQYTGPRRFMIDSLSFVQNVAPNMWLDIAQLPLAVNAALCR